MDKRSTYNQLDCLGILVCRE